MQNCGTLTRAVISSVTSRDSEAATSDAERLNQRLFDLSMLCMHVQLRWPSVWRASGVDATGTGDAGLDALFTHRHAALAALARALTSDATLLQLAAAPINAQTAGASLAASIDVPSDSIERRLAAVGVLARAFQRTVSVMDDNELLEEAKLLVRARAARSAFFFHRTRNQF